MRSTACKIICLLLLATSVRAFDATPLMSFFGASTFSWTATGSYYSTNYTEASTNWTAIIWTNGSGTFISTTDLSLELLVVGGGGAGGTGWGGSGGGGAGGLVNGPVVINGNVTYGTVVGNGGTAVAELTAGSNGFNSIFGTIIAYGGGGGGCYAGVKNGNSGGSGGGAGWAGGSSSEPNGIGGAKTQTNFPTATGYGNKGGDTVWCSGAYGGGGGGGAGAVGGGGNGTASGAGGVGKSYSLSGINTYYSGGGGGGTRTSGGAGGLGGGGAGGVNNVGSAATSNTGGGGGGACDSSRKGGDGGSGVVIIRWQR